MSPGQLYKYLGYVNVFLGFAIFAAVLELIAAIFVLVSLMIGSP